MISEKMDMTPSDPSKGFAGMMANSDPENDTMMFGDFGFKVMMNMPLVTRKDGVCLILKAEEDTYYILANGCMITPFSANQEKPNYDIIALEEGKFVDGQWKAGRRLNGDDPLHFFSILQWGQLKFFLKGILKITLTGVAEIIADLRQRHVGIH